MSKSWKLPNGYYISSDSIVIGETNVNTRNTLTTRISNIETSIDTTNTNLTTLEDRITPIAKGGTGASNMTTARTNLGIDPTWNNFRIGGNINIQSNSGTTASSGYTTKVTFRNTFSNVPYVWVTAIGTSTSNLFELRAGDITSSGFNVYAIKTSGGTLSAGTSVPFRWLAIGQR